MSRIGKRKLVVPAGVTIENVNNVVTVKGPKGELSLELHNGLELKLEDNTLEVICNSVLLNPIHGTTNANLKNMMEGVTTGFTKGLEIIGVGYRFNVKGNSITVNAGYSHPVEMEIPEGLTVEQVSNTEIKVSGIDKVKVGEFAANIRKVRQPEPYKGKGIRYKDEFVRRKEGKKAAK